MSSPIEDYALIGDCQTAALISRDGSVDWLCLPRFDSNACFAALLGTPDHGRWRIAPGRLPGAEAVVGGVTVTRCYRDDTLILETLFGTGSGSVALIDFMPPRDDGVVYVIRIVEGRSGRVEMRSEMSVRFNYGSTTPWVTQLPEEDGIRAVAGPDMVTLRATTELKGEGRQTVATFDVEEGQRFAFVLSHSASHLPIPEAIDAEAARKIAEGIRDPKFDG